MLYRIWGIEVWSGWKNYGCNFKKICFNNCLLLAVLVFGIIAPVRCFAEEYSFAIGCFGNRVNFTNASEEEVVHVSESISDYLFEELSDCNKMKLYDRTVVVTQARANEIMLLTDMDTMAVEYQNSECDYIICGALSNLGISQTNTSVIGIGGNSHVVRVDISLKILDAKSGKCIYTATGKGESCSEDFSFAPLGINLMHFGDIEFSSECYNAALQKAVAEVAFKIKRDI